MYGIGGDKFARETYKQGLLDNAKELLGDPIDPLYDLYEEEETPNVQNALLGLMLIQYLNIIRQAWPWWLCT